MVYPRRKDFFSDPPEQETILHTFVEVELRMQSEAVLAWLAQRRHLACCTRVSGLYNRPSAIVAMSPQGPRDCSACKLELQRTTFGKRKAAHHTLACPNLELESGGGRLGYWVLFHITFVLGPVLVNQSACGCPERESCQIGPRGPKKVSPSLKKQKRHSRCNGAISCNFIQFHAKIWANKGRNILVFHKLRISNARNSKLMVYPQGVGVEQMETGHLTLSEFARPPNIE